MGGDRPATAKNRPATADNRPATADNRPATAQNPPVTAQSAGVVHPTAQAHTARVPLGHDAVSLDPGGWLGAWQELNRAATIPHCVAQLAETGTLDNLRRKTGEFTGPRRGLWFSDSDIYKTLEALGWENGFGEEFAELTALIADAQDDDGYVHSWWGLDGHEPWSDLTNGHEMYCAGHLIQAAVAAARVAAKDSDTLLKLATKFADLLVDRFGQGASQDPSQDTSQDPSQGKNAAGRAADGQPAAIDGHPEIEMALVELWRLTAHRPYLDLATAMVERRGHRTLGHGTFGSAYYLDHVPVRDATQVTGHAVRQLYLLCGVTDVAVETGDDKLLAAAERLWDDAYQAKTYLTGGQGSRHRDESFGDPYELPPDRAYNETCAAIASVMWNWRLLLATGRRRYADELERALYNAVAVGLSADGTHFFYANPLQLRPGHDGSSEDSPSARLSWYNCACCPPNLARLGATLHHYVATRSGDGIQLHLYAPGRIRVQLEAGLVELDVSTAYPWQGEVRIRVVKSPAEPWELALRQPAWCDQASMQGVHQNDAHHTDGYLRARRSWAPGDEVTLTLDMPVQVIAAHPAVDAVRGCVALQRGPIVYCLEQQDQLQVVDLNSPIEVSTQPDGTVTLRGHGTSTSTASSQLYRPANDPKPKETPVRWVATPYYRWANRGVSPMRVWLPAGEG
jgi:DUF1680 family protein